MIIWGTYTRRSLDPRSITDTHTQRVSGRGSGVRWPLPCGAARLTECCVHYGRPCRLARRAVHPLLVSYRVSQYPIFLVRSDARKSGIGTSSGYTFWTFWKVGRVSGLQGPQHFGGNFVVGGQVLCNFYAVSRRHDPPAPALLCSRAQLRVPGCFPTWSLSAFATNSVASARFATRARREGCRDSTCTWS